MSPKQTVELIFSAFSRGDIAAILSHVAPNATWRQAPSLPWGGDYVGAEGAGQFFSRLNDTAETLVFRVDENIEAGKEVFSFGYWEGKVRSTGKVAKTSWAYRWRVENGKITRYEGFHDTAAVVAALS